jgi:hypothetical protein
MHELYCFPYKNSHTLAISIHYLPRKFLPPFPP